jgi:hypothetical protein
MIHVSENEHICTSDYIRTIVNGSFCDVVENMFIVHDGGDDTPD